MPAWPSQERDDEVWAMVAFLRTFADMEVTEYRRLVDGEAQIENYDPPLEMLQASGASGVAETCHRCHGFDGLGRDGAFPRLAGQHSAYLEASLRAFASGERRSGIMQPVAAALESTAIDAVATFYGSLPKAQAIATDHSTLIAKGQRIAEQGIPERFVPACISCHGSNSLPVNPRFPILRGQLPDFLVLQLELFKQRKRGGSDHAHLMQPIASRLEADEMRAVAAYFGSRTADDIAP
jgi:cytochrome c553